MNRATGEIRVTPELEAALTTAGEKKTDPLSVFQAWQSGLREMGAQFAGPLMLDPKSNTFELEADAMARNNMTTNQNDS